MNVLFATLALAATTLVPLNDLGPGPYLWGYYGGLWDVKNTGWATVPAFHEADGIQQAAKIVPRDANGNPDPNGKIGFMAIGYGNTEKTFAAFENMVAGDPRINHESLVMVNAAADGLDATHWDFPWKPTYSQVNATALPSASITPAQVQAVWIQEINDSPTVPLPIQFADSYLLKATLCDILREVKHEYPNVAVAYLSDPQYAGYNQTTKYLSEPFAYEDGLAVRWTLLGQIGWIQEGDQWWDPRIGPLDYNKDQAPWATWRPYFWANGTTPRSDGVTWQRSDFADDGVTLSDAGAAKSAQMLLDFVLHEPTTANWLVPNGPVPPRSRAVRQH